MYLPLNSQYSSPFQKNVGGVPEGVVKYGVPRPSGHEDSQRGKCRQVNKTRGWRQEFGKGLFMEFGGPPKVGEWVGLTQSRGKKVLMSLQHPYFPVLIPSHVNKRLYF